MKKERNETINKTTVSILEHLADDILTSTSCPLFWGEVELPAELKSYVETVTTNAD